MSNYIAVSAIEVGKSDERVEYLPGDVVQGLSASDLKKLEKAGAVREASEAEEALYERREATKKTAAEKTAAEPKAAAAPKKGKEELA
jgi:hypothetical protein